MRNKKKFLDNRFYLKLKNKVEEQDDKKKNTLKKKWQELASREQCQRN